MSNTFGITLDATPEGVRVNDGWQHNRWTVTLTRGGPFTPHRVMRVIYRMGMALDRAPELGEVLESLQSDARIVIDNAFDEVFGDAPYSVARKMADEMTAQTKSLRNLLADDFDAFMATELGGDMIDGSAAANPTTEYEWTDELES